MCQNCLALADFDMRGKCAYCGRKIKLRSPSNDPAYCSYECAVNGQPDKAKASMGAGKGTNAA